MTLDVRVVEDWSSPLWRLDHLYHIVNDQGDLIPFRMNDAQRELYERLWYWNLVLKGRQQGFSTFIGLLALDQMMFREHYRAGVIAQTLPDCTKLFRMKIERPYLHLPAALREHVGLDRKNATELVLGNGSSVQVGMSLRGDTVNLLHVSEFGKICRTSPERAREIVTGAFKTVAVGQIGIIESTAEGEGYYKDYCYEALERKARGETLTTKDFRLHFFAWWRKPANRMDPAGVEIDANMALYFDKLQFEHGILLDAEQRAWYVKESARLKGDMHREEPSYPREAFEVALKGAYYEAQMLAARRAGRIGLVPWQPELPVNTFWDFGVSTNNETTIWLHQKNGLADCFIGYYEAEGKGLGHFVQYLQELTALGYIWGHDYLPHDGAARLQGEYENAETREDILNRLGRPNTIIVPRVKDINNGIELTQEKMGHAYFDETNCARGIACLDNYVRRYDTVRACFTATPLHNWASNGADAFRQWGQAGPSLLSVERDVKRRANWRVV